MEVETALNCAEAHVARLISPFGGIDNGQFAFKQIKFGYESFVLIAQKYNKQNNPIMILPQVHLRKPCYDFYFL